MTNTKKPEAGEPIGKQTADLVGEKKASIVDEVATDLAKDAVKEEARLSTGTESDAESASLKYHGSDEIMQFEPILDLAPDAFEAAIAEDADHPLPENKIYGLLALERNGKNRTPYVQAAIKRLGLKEGDALPGGGPGYTNDVSSTSKLFGK